MQTQQLLGTIAVEQEVSIDAPPERVFEAITSGIGEWWDHVFFGGRVSLEPWVGGRFFEEAENGAALFGTVTAIQRPNLLRLSGPLGIRGAVSGSYRFELEEKDGGTLLSLSHSAFGDIDEDAQAAYGEGWSKLLGERLSGYLGRSA